MFVIFIKNLLECVIKGNVPKAESSYRLYKPKPIQGIEKSCTIIDTIDYIENITFMLHKMSSI